MPVNVALGQAVLMQEEKSVAYASKSLSQTEQGYSKLEREMLSVVFGMEKFQTDREPLERKYLEKEHFPILIMLFSWVMI